MVSGAVFATTFSAHAANSARCRPVRTGLANAVHMGHHVHAFQHRLPVVLDEDGYHPLADKPDHCVEIVVEDYSFLQMKAFERGGHPHAKAKRAMLEHVKSHVAFSFRRCATDLAVVLRAGVRRSARPWQQFSVR